MTSKVIASQSLSEFTDKNDDILTTSKVHALSETAIKTTESHKTMSLRMALKTFPKAIFWSMLISTAIIMEAFDGNLIYSFFSFPGFNAKFGDYYGDDLGYQISAPWQMALSQAMMVGEIIGLYLSGFTIEWIGFRWTLIFSLVGTIGFVFIVFFANNLPTLLTGEILMAIPWGVFQGITVSYATEVCPLVLRVYLTTYINLCWVIGQFISSCILRGVLDLTSANAYKIPIGIQWIWPVPIMIGIYFAPESPWWLVKKGRVEEARSNLKRLITKGKGIQDIETYVDDMITTIQLTLKEEQEIKETTSYMDCFNIQNSSFRRTRISTMVWVFSNITGMWLMGYSTYFYIQAGLSDTTSFTFTIVQYALGLIGTLLSWFLIQKLGRFEIYFGGMFLNFFVLLAVGFLGISSNPSVSWAIGTLLLVFTFIYDSTIGSLTFAIVGEIPSAKLRSKTIIVARIFYNIAGIVMAVIVPYMLNPTAWNWQAKSGFFWAGMSFIALVWCWFDFPETKNRSEAELDKLFRDGTKARKFKGADVAVFEPESILERLGDEGIKELLEQFNDSHTGDEESSVQSVSVSVNQAKICI